MKATKVSLWLLLCLLFDCSEKQEVTKPREPKTYYFMMDKSQSVTFEKESLAILAKKFLSDLAHGDTVIVSYIYGNTANLLNKHVIPMKVSPIVQDNRTNQKLQELQRRKRSEKAQNNVLERVVKLLSDPLPNQTATAILEGLHHTQGHNNVTLIFMSDMLEASNLRQIKKGDQLLIDSYDKAIKAAKQDYTLLQEGPRAARNFEILRTVSELCIITPEISAMAGPDSQHVSAYWNEIFRLCGFSGKVNWTSVFELLR